MHICLFLLFSAFFSFSSLAQDADENCVSCQNQIEHIREIEEQIANLQRIKEELQANLQRHNSENHMATLPVELLSSFFQEWRGLADLLRRIDDPRALGISGPIGTTEAIEEFFMEFKGLLERITEVRPQYPEQIVDFFFQYDTDNRFPRSSLEVVPTALVINFFQEWRPLADLLRRIDDPRSLGISGPPGTVDAIEEFFMSYWNVLGRFKYVNDNESVLEFFKHYRD